MPKTFYPLLAGLFVFMAGCRLQENHVSTGAPKATPCSHTVKSKVAVEPRSYTRIGESDSNVVQLQIAMRKFTPARHRGPAVYLAAVMHLGEPEYYHALQRELDAQTIVLYEGVNTDSHRRRVGGNHPDAATAKTNTASQSLQQTMAEALGLVFQLDAIDYDHTNFLNSDLSVVEIEKIMTAEPSDSKSQGNSALPANASFQTLLQIMDGSSFLGSLFKLGIKFLAYDPKLQAIAKLTLIEAVGRLQGDLSDMRNLPPDMKQLLKVLIESRNEKVLADLKLELKEIPKSGSVAIFYGAGHMNNLEKRLTTEMKYRPAGETWFNAFSVDLRQNGISATEARSMRALVKWQLDQMQTK